jgi:4,4'-diaponeurosporenoate glycosyltransferase
VLIGWLEVSLLVRWLLGWILALSLPPLPACMPLQQRTVSVLIPARNEAATLPHLLAALNRQSLRPDEVIVIDDDSSDGTAAIARQSADTLGIKIIQPPPLPEGWCGKTWALHNGVQASRGDVLVFLDADTEPAPQFLQRLLAQHEQQGGLVSVQPYHRTEKPY